MNDIDRLKFWETLCSLDGKDIQKDAGLLKKAIVVPKYLYRYRPMSLKSLEALSDNKMYFSTSDYYDDPFDTFINVDIKGMEKFFDGINNSGAVMEAEPVIRNILNVLQIQFSDEQVVMFSSALENLIKNKNFVEYCKSYFRNIRNEIKKDIWSVCFSENGFNETLWLKYAQQHKGFALRYDMENGRNLLCGKYEKCLNCGVNNYGTALYPMYYSDEKYNATKFAQYMAVCMMLEQSGNSAYLQQINTLFGSQTWERERITLIKKECHKYDQEWRMIVSGYMSGPVMRKWIPDAVILGLRMERDEINLVKEIAIKAGIKNIYQSFIDDDGELNAYLLK